MRMSVDPSGAYLGLQINEKLNRDTHIDFIRGEASRVLGLLKSHRAFTVTHDFSKLVHVCEKYSTKTTHRVDNAALITWIYKHTV